MLNSKRRTDRVWTLKLRKYYWPNFFARKGMISVTRNNASFLVEGFETKGGSHAALAKNNFVWDASGNSCGAPRTQALFRALPRLARSQAGGAGIACSFFVVKGIDQR